MNEEIREMEQERVKSPQVMLKGKRKRGKRNILAAIEVGERCLDGLKGEFPNEWILKNFLLVVPIGKPVLKHGKIDPDDDEKKKSQCQNLKKLKLGLFHEFPFKCRRNCSGMMVM